VHRIQESPHFAAGVPYPESTIALNVDDTLTFFV